ncbi:Testis-expressed sequence 38 protein [Sciurus carolinensis]|uniref:Testis-expressed sequence 38 protein n=1 Tax=Sciurus carolinensis TaxID=30640 RepID=A0AA41MJR5_SCICA|nr:Testis-expressed sequence 38 protein [Sciurus carolinensis]
MRCHKMVSLTSINSEPLHKHQPCNAQCSEPGDIIFRPQWGLGLPKTPIGGQIFGAVDSLLSHGPGNKSQHYGSLNGESGPSWHPLLYWIYMQRCHGIKAGIKIDPNTAMTNTEMKVHIQDCLWESDTPEVRGYGLRGSISKVEQCCYASCSGGLMVAPEISFVPPLHKMPPILEHTVSYPLDIYPESNVHYHSLPTLALE